MPTRAEILGLNSRVEKEKRKKRQKSKSERLNVLDKQIRRFEQRIAKYQEAINALNKRLRPLVDERDDLQGFDTGGHNPARLSRD